MKKITMALLGVFYGLYAQAQDGAFVNLTKGAGAADFNGWGMNTNLNVDSRPNGGLAYVMNGHNGLTFSAHSHYGGIRMYTQGYPGGPLDLATGAVMAMSLNSGFVGIRTASPRAALDVGLDLTGGQLGSVLGRLPEGDQVGAGTFLGVRGYSTAGTNDKSLSLEHSFYGVVNSSISFLRGGSTMGGSLVFSTYINTEQMRITGNGQVGIGTASPTEKLSVNGNIRAKEIKVETANWPDYVFKPGYKLMSLAETERHIQKNGHLPEIPTAETVATEGLQLAAMNKLMMKKIEELTLHMIELDKTNRAQEDRIRQLEARLSAKK